MRLRSASALAACVALIFSAAPAQAQQEWSFEGTDLLVTNLAGEITIRGHDGSRIIVRARPGGDDGNLLEYEVKHNGKAEFHVVFPLDRSLSYSYPRRRGGRTRVRVSSWRGESPTLERLYSSISSRDQIDVGGRGDLEAWADLEILIPRGVGSRVKLAVGELRANGVEADLDLDTHSGPVTAENITGSTRIDTGSGSVNARSIRGSLLVDTGSGRVEVTDVEGDEVTIDTGSGSVTVAGARARDFKIDTGSGSVRASRVDAENTVIDTGSGSVNLELMRLSSGDHVIDTGSGGVTVSIPSDASVRIEAETGSGGINLDVPAAQVRRIGRNELALDIGDGRASLTIDTGSGGVRIQAR